MGETFIQKSLLNFSITSKRLWHLSHNPVTSLFPQSPDQLERCFTPSSSGLSSQSRLMISYQEEKATHIFHVLQLQVKFLVSLAKRSGSSFSDTAPIHRMKFLLKPWQTQNTGALLPSPQLTCKAALCLLSSSLPFRRGKLRIPEFTVPLSAQSMAQKVCSWGAAVHKKWEVQNSPKGMGKVNPKELKKTMAPLN